MDVVQQRRPLRPPETAPTLQKKTENNHISLEKRNIQASLRHPLAAWRTCGSIARCLRKKQVPANNGEKKYEGRTQMTDRQNVCRKKSIPLK